MDFRVAFEKRDKKKKKIIHTNHSIKRKDERKIDDTQIKECLQYGKCINYDRDQDISKYEDEDIIIVFKGLKANPMIIIVFPKWEIFCKNPEKQEERKLRYQKKQEKIRTTKT